MIEKRRYLTPSQKVAVIERQNGLCACGCGEKLEPGRIHFDHNQELWEEGSNDIGNFRALIIRHHAKKTAAKAKQRAKEKRIRDRDGLMRARISKRDRLMAKRLGLEPR